MPAKIQIIYPVTIIRTGDFDPHIYQDICYVLQTATGPIGFTEDENLFPQDDPYDWKESHYAEWEKEDEEKRRNEDQYHHGNELESPKLIEKETEHIQKSEEELIDGITTTRNNALYTYIENFKGEQADEQSLLGFCNYYKDEKELDDDSIVIVLTNQNPSEKLQKIYDANNNIIIAIADWTESNDITALTKLIIHALFQGITKSGMKKGRKKKNYSVEINLTHVITESEDSLTSHEAPIDCINSIQLYENHFRIIAKLSKTKFCDNCVRTMISSKVHPRAIAQGEIIIKNIEDIELRKAKLKTSILDGDSNCKIILLKNDNIYLETSNSGIEIDMKTQQKAMYIFFLIRYEGRVLKLDNIAKYNDDFAIIYSLFKDENLKDDNKQSVDNLFNHKERFVDVRKQVNYNLNFLLGKEFADKYLIFGSRNKGYGVSVKKENIHVIDANIYRANRWEEVKFIGDKRSL